MKEITQKLKRISDELFAIKDEITITYENGDEKEEILNEMWNAICGTFAAINRLNEAKDNGKN